MLRDRVVTKRHDVLIVGDNPFLLQNLQSALTLQGFWVSVGENEIHARKLVSMMRPEVAVVLESESSNYSGLEMCSSIRSQEPDAVIILIGSRDSHHDVCRALLQSYKAGADDYLGAPVSSRELVALIEARLKRKFGQTTGLIQAGDLTLDLSEYTARIGEHRVFLRRREFEILATLASSPGTLKTYEELRAGMRGTGNGCVASTIGVHVHRIRMALSQRSSYDFIHTVRGLGYRFQAVPRRSTRLQPDSRANRSLLSKRTKSSTMSESFQ